MKNKILKHKKTLKNSKNKRNNRLKYSRKNQSGKGLCGTKEKIYCLPEEERVYLLVQSNLALVDIVLQKLELMNLEVILTNQPSSKILKHKITQLYKICIISNALKKLDIIYKNKERFELINTKISGLMVRLNELSKKVEGIQDEVKELYQFLADPNTVIKAHSKGSKGSEGTAV